MTFLSAAIGGSIVALRSSLPFAVAGPDSSISVVIAAMVATVVHRLATDGGADLLLPTLIAMSLTTALTGLLLCVLGFTHAGRAIRFVPFPVIGGFLGATGWLMITGAMQVVTDQRPVLANLGAFMNVAIAAKLAAALMVAVALHLALRRSKSPFTMPGVLLAAFAATYLVLLLTGSSLVGAQAHGWMFRPQPMAGLVSPWQPEALHSFSWTEMPALAGDVLAVMFVTIINFLLNTTGIEISTRTEANIDRDLKVLGVANIVTAALGGYVSCTSLSRSILVRTAGASGRLSGLTVAAISAALLIAGPAFVGYVPKYILGGLLFFLGCGPRLSMADPVIAAIVARRLLVAHRHRAADHQLGFYRRRSDRHRHRLRDVCAQHQPRQCDQVQLRRFGISVFARSRTLRAIAPGRSRPGDSGHGAAELSVLRFGQPALPARQGAAGESSGNVAS